MTLEVCVDDGVAVPAPVRKRLVTEVSRMVRAAARTDGQPDFEVALRLTTDAEIRELNRAYRKKDKPTDVLAFAQREGPGGGLQPTLLGDIVISVETARRQAKRGLVVELLHLASHGLRHLLGYDHNDNAEEAAMNQRASALRREGARRGRVQPA
jgi:probable rRNA maturation factor